MAHAGRAAGGAGDVLPSFPADLRIELGASRLLALVLDVVSHLEPVSGGQGFHYRGEVFNFNQTLAVLTYAYLSGLAGSEQIEESLETDPMLRYLSRGTPLDAVAIRRFRRVHRGPLGVALLRALYRAMKAGGEFGSTRASVGGETSPLINAVQEAELLRHCAAEAEARLVRAVFADTMALDV